MVACKHSVHRTCSPYKILEPTRVDKSECCLWALRILRYQLMLLCAVRCWVRISFKYNIFSNRLPPCHTESLHSYASAATNMVCRSPAETCTTAVSEGTISGVMASSNRGCGGRPGASTTPGSPSAPSSALPLAHACAPHSRDNMEANHENTCSISHTGFSKKNTFHAARTRPPSSRNIVCETPAVTWTTRVGPAVRR